MRIGFISKFGVADGLCVRASQVLQGLIDRGHEVHVFTQAKEVEGISEDRITRIRAIALNPHFWLDSPSTIRSIAKKASEHKLDVLHIQMNSSSTEFIIPFFKKQLPPIIATLHLAYTGGNSIYTAGFAVSWKASMFAVKRFDHVVLVDPSQQRVLSKKYGIQNSRMSVIRNGVDTDVFAPRVTSKKSGVLHFVFIGRLSLDKGVHILLDAFSQYHRENKDSKLTLVGDGLLKNTVDRYDDDGSIKWVGTLDHEMIPAILRSADVFVIPQNIGGLGLSVIEAMSCGIPVITTAIGETTKLLSSEEGVLVEPDCSDSVLKAMRILGSDEKLRRSMGDKCREKVLREYSWSTQIEHLEQVYSKVIQSHS